MAKKLLREQFAAAADVFCSVCVGFFFEHRCFFSLLIHCRNYDGFPGRALRDDVITVTVNYGNNSNANLVCDPPRSSLLYLLICCRRRACCWQAEPSASIMLVSQKKRFSKKAKSHNLWRKSTHARSSLLSLVADSPLEIESDYGRP